MLQPTTYLGRVLRLTYTGVLSLICLMSISQVALAWDLDGTPPTNYQGVRKMPTDFTQDIPENTILSTVATKGPARVRIGIRLTPYRKVVFATKDGRTMTKYRQDTPLVHNLRARLNKTNHFFFDEFHIETTPLSWAKQSRYYKIRITVHKRYGAYGKIEELIGKVDLGGSLVGGNGLYVLRGSARAKFQNKRGNPIVDLIAGSSQPKSSQKQQKLGNIKNNQKKYAFANQRNLRKKGRNQNQKPESQSGIANYRRAPQPRGVSAQKQQEKKSNTVKAQKYSIPTRSKTSNRSEAVIPIAKPTKKRSTNGWGKM